MNAMVPHAGTSLVPQNMREAMDMAAMVAKTPFLPRELQNLGGAMFVIEQAMRWNMSVYAVAMETSFISGKPMFSGKLVAAAVQSIGGIVGRLTYDYSGQGDDRTVIVRGTMRGEPAPRGVTVRVCDVKTSNKYWTTQPDQQLAYSGARVWARRHAPEVMLGVSSEEEFEPKVPFHGTTIEGTTEPPSVIPQMIVEDKFEGMAERLLARVAHCETVDALLALAGDIKVVAGRATIAKARPDLDENLTDAFAVRHDELRMADSTSVGNKPMEDAA